MPLIVRNYWFCHFLKLELTELAVSNEFRPLPNTRELMHRGYTLTPLPVLEQVLKDIVGRSLVSEGLPGLGDVGQDLVGEPVPLAQEHRQAEVLQVLILSE